MAQHTELERLLTINEAAEILNVSAKTISRRINAGDIAIIRHGRIVRISPEDLARYLSRHRFG